MAQLLLAFFAGFISFLSPCVLPLIPGYISYVSGSTLNELLESKRVNIIPTVLFTIGFSIVFIAFGATSTLIGNFVLTNSFELRIVSGAIIILFSLQLLGLFNFKFLNIEKRFQTERRSNKLYPVLVGMAFGFGWTPCIGPQLGAILSLAASNGSILKGTILLGFYAIGLGIPFLLFAVFINKIDGPLKILKKHFDLIEKIMGLMLWTVGLLMLTGGFSSISFWLLESFPSLGSLG